MTAPDPWARSPRAYFSRYVADDPHWVPADIHIQALARSAIDQLVACQQHSTADWTYITPSAIMEPGLRGNYRTGADQLLIDPDGHSYLSMEDMAAAVLDEVEHPAHKRHSSPSPPARHRNHDGDLTRRSATRRTCPRRAEHVRLSGAGSWEADVMPMTPMFPLGSVLVPGMVLPLHVFEPRYRRLVEDCQADDSRFGVVLIERGSEVGGGDVRTDVGTLARIVRADQTDDGRWMLLAVGEQRIRVERWLPDDPYPQAEVSEWPDSQPVTGPETAAGEAPLVQPGDWAEVSTLLRRAAALSREIGEPAPPLDLQLADDPGLASYQSAAVAPLGEADRQRLLVTPSVPERLALLEQMLAEQIEVLQARLGGG